MPPPQARYPSPSAAMLTAPATCSHLPTSLLRAELARRQNEGQRPACGSGTSTREYNTALHVVALFQILLLSTLACSFPVLVRRFPTLPVPNHAIFVCRHFGTGVLIATAFVHLLPTAYVSLTDPCLPPFWNRTYPAMAGFVAMVSVMIVVGIEMFFAAKGAGHSHSVDLAALGRDDGRGARPTRGRGGSFKPPRQVPLRASGEFEREDGMPLHEQRSPYVDKPGAVDKPLPRTPSIGETESDEDLDLDELDSAADDDTRPLNGSLSRKHRHRPSRPPNSRQVSFATPPSSSSSGHQPHPLPSSATEQRAVLQCLLLEAGILFHSIFIGLALSVSVGPAFIVLLIAISFHQTFEGLALGSRIAAISSFSTTSAKPWLMSFLYGITTPLGQAIGLGVHGLYDPASQIGLLTVGLVNAISSGLLLYAGLVQLLAEDFLSDRSYVDLRGRRRLEACAAVVCGSLLMAFVGAFA